MSKISRQTMLMFASSAGSDQIEQFGSLAGGIPNYTTAIPTIQSLSAWLEGWFGGVVGANLPAIEDLNAVCYVFAYMLCYVFQSGIPEYDAGTTYYQKSLCIDGSTGIVYISLIDSNIGNTPASSPSDWAAYSYPFKEPTVTIIGVGSGTYTVPAGAVYLRIKMCGGGGGGAGGGGSPAGDGSNGTQTTFGPSSGATLGLVAQEGSGGLNYSHGTAAGAGGIGGLPDIPISPAISINGLVGGQGQSAPFTTGISGAIMNLTVGGSTFISAPSFQAGLGGYGGSSDSGGVAGGAGGGGAYMEVFLNGPLSSTYAYSVGTGGAAGAPGTSAQGGGPGQDGIIVIEEYYC